jgi:O-antigen/teichoic acid export membrane protein
MIVSTLALGLLLIPIAIFGRSILRIVYGAAVVAFYVPMLLQLANMVIGIVTRLWFYFYRGVHDTRAVLRANALCTIVGVSTLFILGPLWKSTGVVLASLCSYVAIVVYCVYHWNRYKEELLLRFPGDSSVVAATSGSKSN